MKDTMFNRTVYAITVTALILFTPLLITGCSGGNDTVEKVNDSFRKAERECVSKGGTMTSTISVSMSKAGLHNKVHATFSCSGYKGSMWDTEKQNGSN